MSLKGSRDSMRKTKLRIACEAAVIMVTSAIQLESCQSPTAGSSAIQKATIQVDTVTYNQFQTQSDSGSLYLNVEVKWGLALSPTRADSLANWFAESQFKIEDMWFPASGPVCYISFNTFNYVFVRLEHPDTLLDTLGFNPASGPNACFPTWTHYKFIWAANAS